MTELFPICTIFKFQDFCYSQNYKIQHKTSSSKFYIAFHNIAIPKIKAILQQKICFESFAFLYSLAKMCINKTVTKKILLAQYACLPVREKGHHQVESRGLRQDC